MISLEEKISSLPPEIKAEVNDFVDFLIEKNYKEDTSFHPALSEKSLNKIWDNPGDDVYNELLKK